MNVDEVGPVRGTHYTEVTTHQLIEQLATAVANERPERIQQLIGAIQGRCLSSEGSVHPYINPLVQAFLDLSAYTERAQERYHLAQLLSLISHRASMDRPNFFRRIPGEHWAQLKGMIGEDPLLDFHLYCFWGGYWRLCYPEDKPNWRSYLNGAYQMFRSARAAAEADFDPAVEYGKEIIGKIKDIPPDWVHRAGLAISWGLDPKRYENLMNEVDKTLSTGKKSDEYLLIAGAHAFAVVLQRRDQNSVSAFDRLQKIACIGKPDKPTTNRFWQARLHAWSLLLSLAPEWNCQSLARRQLVVEKNAQVRALLEKGGSSYNCLFLTCPESSLPTAIDDDLIEDTKEYRAGLRELQDGMVQRLNHIISNQRIIIENQRRADRRVSRLMPSPTVFGQLEKDDIWRISRICSANRIWHQRVCAESDLLRQRYWRNHPPLLHYNREVGYQKVWEALCKPAFPYRIPGLEKLLRSPRKCWDIPDSRLGNVISAVWKPIHYSSVVFNVPGIVFVSGFDLIYHKTTGVGRCACLSCSFQRRDLVEEFVRPYHHDLAQCLKYVLPSVMLND